MPEKLASGCVSDSKAKPWMSASGPVLRATDASQQKKLAGFCFDPLKISNINWTCSCPDYGGVRGHRWEVM